MNRTYGLLFGWLVLAICLSAAWAAPTFSDFPPQSIGLHQTGGIAGLQDWVVIKLDGTVYRQSYKKSSQGKGLDAAHVQALVHRVETSGFFDWKPAYQGMGIPPDGMTTELWFDDGHRRHRVLVSDPATAPPGFHELAAAIRAAAAR